MNFGDILGKSFKDFKSNWKVTTKLLVLFSFIPSLILAVLTTYTQTNPENLTLAALMIVFTIPIMFLAIFASTAILVGAMKGKNSKVDYNGSIKGAKEFFWRYIGYSILVSIIMVGIIFVLGGLPIILAISLSSIPIGALAVVTSLLAIYLVVMLSLKWYFSIYILVEKNKSISESMRESTVFTNGRKDVVLGYSLLFMLIVIGIAIVISIPFSAIVFFLSLGSVIAAGTEVASMTFGAHLLTNIFNSISEFLTNVFIIPLGVFFGKNFYQAMKKK